MVTFLAGGTGTPKLLDGLGEPYPPAETTVIANTGDDVELGGLFVCPDIDTLLYRGGDRLDRDTWWGVADDTTSTHEELRELSPAAGIDPGPRYLPEEHQTEGHPLGAWRRFSAAGEFMQIGDRDRALHLLRTSLLQEGQSLATITARLADAMDVAHDLLPMSNDPVATMVHTPDGPMHFQEYWVAHGGEPTVTDVSFRGADAAVPAPGVLDALSEPVVIGPSNPVTSIGPMLALDGFADQLQDTTVVAVSPFRGGEAFSGPAAALMAAVGYEPTVAGLVDAYPWLDGVVIDEADDPAVVPDHITLEQTNVHIGDRSDAQRILSAVEAVRERLGDGT